MIELESNEPPEVLLAKVRETLPTPWTWHLGGAHARTPFYGKVNDSGFWIMKKKSRFERNAANPVLVARITPAQNGSRISATVRVPLPMQAFFAVWCVLVLALGGTGLYQTMTSEFASDKEVAPIFAVVMCIMIFGAGIAYLIGRSISNRRRPELEAWLRNIVEKNITE